MRVPNLRWSLFVALSLGVSALGCRSGGEAPEPGAMLLRLTLETGTPAPDELRVSVFDETGALWRDARVPEQGALAAASGKQLGTLLIQPGATTGTVRLDVVGLAGRTRVAEGLLSIAPSARSHGTFDLLLAGAPLPDGDADSVPDAIDDCPGIANATQGGCPGGNDDGGPPDAPMSDASGGTGGGGGSGTGGGGGGGGSGGSTGGGGTGGGTDGGPSCGFAGGCNLAQGAACTDAAQCLSGFCADGVCCANACTGRCRACNQPGNDGVCLGYGAGTDPEFECSSGMTCNGAGACGPASPPGNRANGDLCTSASECGSGSCKDGVCCNTACTGACLSCGTGTCTAVKSGTDVPECVSPMRCNPSGKCVVN